MRYNPYWYWDISLSRIYAGIWLIPSIEVLKADFMRIDKTKVFKLNRFMVHDLLLSMSFRTIKNRKSKMIFSLRPIRWAYLRCNFHGVTNLLLTVFILSYNFNAK